MYNEIELINKIDNSEIKIKLLLLFIEEYSGWLQHVKSVGLFWGADGEEYKANKEAIKVRKHIDKLNNKILEFCKV